MLKPQHEESQAKRIQREFEYFEGGSTNSEFASHLLAIGFWDDDALAKVTLKFAQREVEKALKEVDANGLPFAIPSAAKADSGASIWKQLDFCSFEDVELQVQRLHGQEMAIRANREDLVRYAVKRWNRIPSLDSQDEARESA